MSVTLNRVLLCFGLAFVTASVLAHDGFPGGEKVGRKAYPFPLEAVRILDGPFHRAMMLDQQFILGLDNDRLLHTFRLNAGIPSNAVPYGGWEGPNVELRGHTIGHVLTACAFMYGSTGDLRFKGKADSLVRELVLVQRALKDRGSLAGYLSAFPEEFIDRVEKQKRVWAPYYTLHKIMAGLLDVSVHCGNKEALDAVTSMADWVGSRMDRLTTAQQQAMLETEYGGMNDVLARLSMVTGNPEYLRLAAFFDHKVLFDQWAQGVDSLNWLHGNTQIPKAIGAVKEYALTGERYYFDAARFFWDRVANHRAYVIGGNTNDERFFPPKDFAHNLGASSTETCNSYNMLKLSRDLFSFDPSPAIMEYYERTLINHILASQDPASGMVCYYVSMKPGAFRTYSTPDSSFWCCVGTGMENHATYGEAIYFHDDRSLFVNLMIASELAWSEKRITIRQETRFPEEDRTRLTVRCEEPVTFRLMIRYPRWAAGGVEIVVNNQKMSVEGNPGSYVPVERRWNTGDVVEVRWPMKLHLEFLKSDPSVVSVLYGPMVLAGDLGSEGLTRELRYGDAAPPLRAVPQLRIPAFVSDRQLSPGDFEQVGGSGLVFRSRRVGKPADITLVPFHQIHDRRYSVYWNVFSQEQWRVRNERLDREETRRLEIERLTIDAVNVSDREDERRHDFRHEGAWEHWFDAQRSRETRVWMSFTLKSVPDEPVTLVCTYQGGPERKRAFRVVIDDTPVAEHVLDSGIPSLVDHEYEIPESVTRGKDRITITFEALPGANAGALFEMRTVRRK